MKRIAILDYGCGNLRSVSKALEYIGAAAFITGDKDEAKAADAIIFPGVGAFIGAIGAFMNAGFDECLRDAINAGKPTLGICLGMQMMMNSSEEDGATAGLAIFDGDVTRFPQSNLKVPHMGWNSITPNPACPLFNGVPSDAYVYFVHSYRVAGVHDYTAASCDYGKTFTAAVYRGNLFGTQFHPEKSGDIGLAMLRNFAGLM